GCCEKIIWVGKACADDIARVVDDERVGDDEGGLPGDPRPVRYGVVVAIRAAEESAFRCGQLQGIHAQLPAVPAGRASTGCALDGGHGAVDGLSLVIARHLEVIAPAVAMACGFVAPRRQLLGDGGIAFQGYGRGEKRDWYTGAVEHPEQA